MHRISHEGEVEVFYRGLGRPQGMAFDDEGTLYVAASIAGRKGVVRIDPDRRADLFLSGPGIVGLAFTPSRAHGRGHHQRALPRGCRHQGPAARLMNAEIIAVGSEMLTPQRVDTNSLYLTAELNDLGVEVVTKCGDRRRSRPAGRRQSARRCPRSEIVILSGGLGPDRGRRHARRRRRGARPQADLPPRDRRRGSSSASPPPSGRWPRSTSARRSSSKAPRSCPTIAAPRPANGSRNPARSCMLLPGPPHELKAMFERQCLPRLARIAPQAGDPHAVPARRRHGGVDLDQLIAPVYKKYENPATTILAAAGDIQIHLRARCETEPRPTRCSPRWRARSSCCWATASTRAMAIRCEVVVGDLLRKNRRHGHRSRRALPAACWASASPQSPGSSDYFAGGFITYTNAMKMELLGVQPEILAEHRRGQQGDRRGDGARRAPPHAIHLRAFDHRGGRPGGGRPSVPKGTMYVGLADAAGTTVRATAVLGDRQRSALSSAGWRWTCCAGG